MVGYTDNNYSFSNAQFSSQKKYHRAPVKKDRRVSHRLCHKRGDLVPLELVNAALSKKNSGNPKD